MKKLTLIHLILLAGPLGLRSAPSTIQFSAATFEINELDRGSVLEVTCTPAASTLTRVLIRATGGTAQWPADYLRNEFELQLLPGETARSSDFLTILDDGLPEPDETVELTLVRVEGGAMLGGLTNATLIIHNGQAHVDIDDTRRYHGLENQAFAFTAVRRGDTNFAVSFDCATTTNGTASPGTDFVPVNERIVLQPGEIRKGIVPLVNDGEVEPSETIELLLSNPSNGATLGSSNVTAVVYDDEIPANLDLSFAPDFSNWPWGSMNAVAIQTDGKILLAAEELFRDGSQVAMIRLHPDGRLDPSFRIDLVAQISSLAPAPDGKILIAGEKPDRIPDLVSFVARLLPTGAVDATFTPSAGVWPQSSPSPGVLVQSDGKTVLWWRGSGNLERLNLNGSLDGTFGRNLPSLGSIEQAQLHQQDKLLLNVTFEDRGSRIARLVRLNPNGSPDPTFIGPLSGEPEDLAAVRRFLILSDDRIMVQCAGGEGVLAGRRFVRLHRDGSFDGSFAEPRLIPASGLSHWSEKLLAEVDGYLYFVPGEAGPDGPGLARIRPDGSLDSSFACLWGKDVYCGWSASYGGPRHEIPHAIGHRGALLCWNPHYSSVNGANRPLARILLKDSPEQAFIFQGEPISSYGKGFAAYEAAGQVQIRVLRLGRTSQACTVRYATRDGTARAMEQYITTAGTLTFAPMEKEKTIAVPLIQDDVFRGKPHFFLTLNEPSIPAALDQPARVDIYDREPGLVSPQLQLQRRYVGSLGLQFEVTGPEPQMRWRLENYILRTLFRLE